MLGSLTFGGHDASRFTSSNVSFRFASDSSRDLVVGIQSIVISKFSHDSSSRRFSRRFSLTNLLPSPILSFIDSIIPHIWLPLDACQLFEDTLTEVTGIIVRYRAFGGPLLEDCIATDTVYIH